mmetsp:Transcript_18779/g.44519  ORF Transcript_18779/g.44519 Transcript_18779/m.44519 type:complete len:91 (-) Transcript_18779:20-292(-)
MAKSMAGGFVSAKSLFSGTPPFGMPHVNPTIETWGAGDEGVPYTISPATVAQSGYSGLDNEIGSPEYFIPYDGVNGPDDGHKWLPSPPLY